MVPKHVSFPSPSEPAPFALTFRHVTDQLCSFLAFLPLLQALGVTESKALALGHKLPVGMHHWSIIRLSGLFCRLGRRLLFLQPLSPSIDILGTGLCQISQIRLTPAIKNAPLQIRGAIGAHYLKLIRTCLSLALSRNNNCAQMEFD